MLEWYRLTMRLTQSPCNTAYGQYHITPTARTVPEETCDHDNGGCGQICVAHAHGHKKHCACREGYTLEGDGLTCRGKRQKQQPVGP